jgi:hypothetical protein
MTSPHTEGHIPGPMEHWQRPSALRMRGHSVAVLPYQIYSYCRRELQQNEYALPHHEYD